MASNVKEALNADRPIVDVEPMHQVVSYTLSPVHSSSTSATNVGRSHVVSVLFVVIVDNSVFVRPSVRPSVCHIASLAVSWFTASKMSATPPETDCM